MSRNSLVEKFAKSSGIDEDIANQVVISFFNYVKSCIKSKSLPDIRLKGLGMFTINPARLKFLSKDLDKKFGSGIIGEETYKKKKEMIDNYLDNIK